MHDLWRDLAHGLRLLRRNPGFAAAAVLTLALGIGSVAAVFTLVRGVLLSALPYHEPDGLVLLAGRMREAAAVGGEQDWPVGVLDLADLAEVDRGRTFAGVAAASAPRSFNLSFGGPSNGAAGEAEHATGEMVSPDYFRLLGVPPRLGRALQPADDCPPDGARVAVVSHDLWRRRLGGDRAAVGRLNGAVLAAALEVALLCGVLAGLAPALGAARSDLHADLRGGGRGATFSPRRRRMASILVVAEVGLALALLAGAGLLGKGFGRLVGTDLGFTPEGLLTMRLDLAGERYAEREPVWALARQLLAGGAGLPGVESFALEGPGRPTSGWYGLEAGARGQGGHRVGPAHQQHPPPREPGLLPDTGHPATRRAGLRRDGRRRGSPGARGQRVLRAARLAGRGPARQAAGRPLRQRRQGPAAADGDRRRGRRAPRGYPAGREQPGAGRLPRPAAVADDEPG